VVLVDCRRLDEYAVSKIPGSENLHFKCTDDEISQHFEKIGVNQETDMIISYCSLGYRSAIMTNRIKELLAANPNLNQSKFLAIYSYWKAYNLESEQKHSKGHFFLEDDHSPNIKEQKHLFDFHICTIWHLYWHGCRICLDGFCFS